MGGFRIRDLGETPGEASIELWRRSLTFVQTGFMPPREAGQLAIRERHRLAAILEAGVRRLEGHAEIVPGAVARRMNNREIVNSLRDVLMIEDVGTHQPMAGLVGDTLLDGFDTIGDTLGMSQFHLEQYIEAIRKVVDATILGGPRPESRRYEVTPAELRMTSLSQRRRDERANRTAASIEFLDPRLRVYFSNFETAPATGKYRIEIRATGKDRGIYDSTETGIHDGDPIRLRVHLGDRALTFDLPDETPGKIVLHEWIAAGTRIELSYPTDGLRLRGNGNFKFQFSIAHDHIRRTNPELFARVLAEKLPHAPARTARSPGHWSHWTEQWQGARPRLFGAEIVGPIYDRWPPQRQVRLLGDTPRLEDATAILRPIAERAWRRKVEDRDLEPIVRLATATAARVSSAMTDIDGLKEGIVAILASPAFLVLNRGDGSPSDRFASRLSFFLGGTIPDSRLLQASSGGRLDAFEAVRDEVRRRFDVSAAEEFLREFPRAWLELDRINFMAPDPDRFPRYSRKRLSEDMVAEMLQFFRHAVENNLPVPELLAADYSFLNADLAELYGVEGVPRDSQLRKHRFTDGRRGGLLGMGAFLTLTADSLSTSPIHRGVYVMEKFLGIHPAPPPGDVEIAEPDIRQARTVKEVLAAHTTDPTCASCHRTIDPYGYAFENFDPVGTWRDEYTAHVGPKPSRARLAEIENEDRQRKAAGLGLVERPWEQPPIPVDAAARLPDGKSYRDIVEFRRLMLSAENRDRFVRCFIRKLLLYANGAEPGAHAEIESIVARSAANGYRIVDTIAAVVHSGLFRE